MRESFLDGHGARPYPTGHEAATTPHTNSYGTGAAVVPTASDQATDRNGPGASEEVRPGQSRQRLFPFWLKLTLATGPLVVVPFAILAPIVLNELSLHQRRTHREIRLLVARDVATGLTDRIRRAEDHLRSIGHLLLDPSLEPGESETLVTHRLSGTSEIDELTLFDPNGRVYLELRDERLERPEVPITLPRSLRDKARALGSTATWDPEHRSTHLRVVQALERPNDGSHAGYVSGLVPLGPLEDHLETLSIAHLPPQSGRIVVVDEQLRPVAASHPLPLPWAASLAEHPLFDGYDHQLLEQESRPAITTEYEGEEAMVGSIAPVPGLAWAVAVESPRSHVYATVETIRRLFLICAAAALFVALVVAFVLARHLSNPIAQLVAFTRRLAARNFASRVHVQTQDEFRTLGGALNDAAEELETSEMTIKKDAEIRSDLGRYLPADLVDRVMSREQDMDLGGRRFEVTILFADVVGFTELSRRLNPDEIVLLLNELFSLLTEIVFRNSGTVDKFIGDCVMAMWGAPVRDDAHADKALRTAEDMLRWVETANAGWSTRFGVDVRLAIGLHSGPAVVGNVGSKTRMEYTAIGDTVNVAAQLEAIARPNQVLTTEDTVRLVNDRFPFRRIGERTLGGKEEALVLYELGS